MAPSKGYKFKNLDHVIRKKVARKRYQFIFSIEWGMLPYTYTISKQKQYTISVTRVTTFIDYRGTSFASSHLEMWYHAENCKICTAVFALALPKARWKERLKWQQISQKLQESCYCMNDWNDAFCESRRNDAEKCGYGRVLLKRDFIYGERCWVGDQGSLQEDVRSLVLEQQKNRSSEEPLREWYRVRILILAYSDHNIVSLYTFCS